MVQSIVYMDEEEDKKVIEIKTRLNTSKMNAIKWAIMNVELPPVEDDN